MRTGQLQRGYNQNLNFSFSSFRTSLKHGICLSISLSRSPRLSLSDPHKNKQISLAVGGTQYAKYAGGGTSARELRRGWKQVPTAAQKRYHRCTVSLITCLCLSFRVFYLDWCISIILSMWWIPLPSILSRARGQCSYKYGVQNMGMLPPPLGDWPFF